MSRSSGRGPTIFRELNSAECLVVLAKHDVGRLAFTFHDRFDVERLNYVIVGNDLIFRTTPGSKLDVLQHHPWVAFAVDDVDGAHVWVSVVAHGTIYPLDRMRSSEERAAHDIALERLRDTGAVARAQEQRLTPVLLRLRVDRLTGSEARAR